MDNTAKFLRIMENPDIYSDAELLELLSDEDFHELYETMCLSASAFEIIDVHKRTSDGLKEEEWHNFEARMQKGCHRSWPKMRIVAILICMLVLSGMIYAVININKGKEPLEDIPSIVQSEKTVGNKSKDEKIPIDTVVKFKNAELGYIVSRLESHYHVKAEFLNEKVCSLRFYMKWNPSEPLDTVVASLNAFEMIDITLKENTLTVR